MLDNYINIKFPVFDHCTVCLQIAFLDDISNQLIFNYGRFRNFSPLESSIEEGENKKMGVGFWGVGGFFFFLVSCTNTNWHGELRCHLVVRVPFILGTDLTEPKTF